MPAAIYPKPTHGFKSGGWWPVWENRDSGQENIIKKAFLITFYFHSED
jgi:hypothetical protein